MLGRSPVIAGNGMSRSLPTGGTGLGQSSSTGTVRASAIVKAAADVPMRLAPRTAPAAPPTALIDRPSPL